MVWHNYITASGYLFFLFQVIKPFIHQVVAIGKLEQRQPIVTGEGYEIQGGHITMSCTNRHLSKYKKEPEVVNGTIRSPGTLIQRDRQEISIILAVRSQAPLGQKGER
jgi:hypothetical protein